VATEFQVTFDCADPGAMAGFWSKALGYRVPDPPDGFGTWEAFLRSIDVPESELNARSAIEDPEGTRPRIFFQRVPEPKTSKNRVHLDLNAGGGHGIGPDERRQNVDAKVQALTALGATVLRTHEEGLFDERWVVMHDLEGNEFCVQ
jgi:Glyoxalase-like domain